MAYRLEVVTLGRPNDPIVATFESKSDAHRLFVILHGASNRQPGTIVLESLRVWKEGETRDLLFWVPNGADNKVSLKGAGTASGRGLKLAAKKGGAL